MGRTGFVARHKVAVASNTALVLAAAAVLAYAVAADGYQAHEAQLNDGGIWVVNGDSGIHGRINKPINQLDTSVLSDGGEDRPLDVVQDGAAVLAIDRKASTAQVIDPFASKLDAAAKVSIPSESDQQAAGGTFASIDPETGDLWAVQLDPQRGRPVITSLDAQSDPLASVGEGAALAVSQSGTVVATSGEEGTVTYVVTAGDGFAKPRTEDLPAAAGAPTAVTTVGDQVVTFDAVTGQLSVIGAGSATLALDAVLQQPGPSASSVLVATHDQLMEVNLATGTTTVVIDGPNGKPAEPVRLGACSYAAWSRGLGEVAIRCGDDEATPTTLGGQASELTFRLNRGEIVLNDNKSGAVWDIDAPEPERIDNWNAFTSSKQVQDEDKKSEEQTSGDRTPPKAQPDEYGARAGRTTILHPLDNDSAPQGRLLSIIDIDQPTGGASAQISPDGQTIVLKVPGGARNTSFDYTIDDGRSNFTDHATVTVKVRGDAENEQPTLREGFESRRWHVPAAGSLTVPVLSDWRDDTDGDALVLDSAVALGVGESGASARTTSDGRVRFTGSPEGGETVQVEVTVSDGRSAPVPQTLTFDVQEKSDRKKIPASAEPDVVRGEVGTPIKIRPLLNDLPGSDPSTPYADLALGGKIPAQPGATIRTDVESGIITFVGDRPGTYFLDYEAAFGFAELDRETIRVDVLPAPKTPGAPITMPDTLTVYGQAAGVVDVLANDVDPAGGLLVVQRAFADNPDVDVAVIDGRWLRISAPQGRLSPNPQLVRYTVSNGATSGIEGEVSVSHRPVPGDNTPVTTVDRVHVRSGSSVTVPVLDNDIAPSGDRLTLVSDTLQGVPGELKIDVAGDVKGDLGTALVSGRSVRYIAPDLKERDSFQVIYLAQSSTGETTNGLLVVTITPQDDPNTAPEPPTLEGRAVGGATIKVRLPGSGVDPEGDPVTVAGLISAPRFGRVLSYGGNFLEYQAYPRATGTDEFEYSVVDSHGGLATGLVRVAVVPPGSPQPPLAVADQLTVEAGRTAVFDPLSNDFIAPGDEVKITLVDPPDGVTLDPETDLVSVPAPKETSGASSAIVYSITNGIDVSLATLKVETGDEFENPPVVYDAFGRTTDSGGVSVDVLEGAYDPDGEAAALTVTKVYGTEGSPTIEDDNRTIRVNRGPNPIVVPFRVEDANGAAATASLYVPPTGTGIPYVKPDALIELEEGGSAEGKLSDFIINPSGNSLRLTSGTAVSTSPPTDLEPARVGDDGFEISARDGYRGPGALLLEVTTATNAAGNEDPQDPTDGFTALLSIPVQVGDDLPVLACPEATIPISAGEFKDLDIAALCNVWTPDPADMASLVYEGTWTQEVEALSVDGNGTQVLRVTAADDADRGGVAALSITGGGSAPSEIRFRLDNPPPPSMLPIPPEQMDAGQSREINLAPFLKPGVAEPNPTVVSIEVVSGVGVSASRSGSSVTLRASKEARGRAVFRVVMSDVDDSSPAPGRRAEGRLEVTLAGVPGQPGTPYKQDNEEKGVARISWFAPEDDGGSPITHYILKETRSNDQIRCRTNLCDYPGLKDGKKYNFRVAAVNKVGTGPFSDLSLTAQAATKPGRVASISMVDRGDHTITVGWTKPAGEKTIEAYMISWPGGGPVTVAGTSTSHLVDGLDNNRTYVFSVEAKNSVGWSPPRLSAPFQSMGTPAAPAGLTAVDQQSGVQSTNINAIWTATAPEGPAPTLYSLSYSANGGPMVTVPGCGRIQATSCTHSGVVYDGTNYNYYVQAHNAENTSVASAPFPIDATGKPANWGAWTVGPTGQDTMVRVTATAPEPRGELAQASILVAGQVVWTLRVQTGAVINEVVRTPSNEEGYPVQLRMCNENAARVGCSFSDVKSVQAYGPFRESHLNQPTAEVSGLTVTWTISGTSNGDPAVVGLRIDGGSEEMRIQSAPGAFSFTKVVAVGTYNTSTTIAVRLFDDNPLGRGETTDYQQAESGDPPTPLLSIYKRASCDDDDLDSNGNPITSNDCSNLGAAGCTDARCGFLGLRVSDGRDGIRCSVTDSDDPATVRPALDVSNGETATPWYFDNGRVEVTCQFRDRGRLYATVVSSMDWP
ncbi:Ig-like domain-containing protein [Nocardioides sp.]|uniref:Ig-like domain-containing protein n=1 Tax=Nocardioides sp. TaxID=35761 RepID=UPI002B585296|nr:Ig-like domain-containing protein [Nocardioides sp.]HXH76900.1 Ig-like domain-containing protein [Nocardioides sp.]